MQNSEQFVIQDHVVLIRKLRYEKMQLEYETAMQTPLVKPSPRDTCRPYTPNICEPSLGWSIGRGGKNFCTVQYTMRGFFPCWSQLKNQVNKVKLSFWLKHELWIKIWTFTWN